MDHFLAQSEIEKLPRPSGSGSSSPEFDRAVRQSLFCIHLIDIIMDELAVNSQP
jgi:hypothetical protein